MSGKMLTDNRTKRQKNIHRMPERCRILVPVSKGNWGNKKKFSRVIAVIFNEVMPCLVCVNVHEASSILLDCVSRVNQRVCEKSP
jgi:hypothetical protein